MVAVLCGVDVQNQAAGHVTREQLVEMHKLIIKRQQSSAQALKDNVFSNYPLYIGASNEISQFEKVGEYGRYEYEICYYM